MRFFEVLKALMPRSKAFSLTKENNFRSFIKGLSYLPEDVRKELELVYGDLWPSTTRSGDEWEKQFGVVFGSQHGHDQVDILTVLWQMNSGGQSAYCIEQILKKIIPNILVVENIPVRNPRDANVAITAVCGNNKMCCGNKIAVNAYRFGDELFTPSVIKNDSEGLYDIRVDTRYWESCFFLCGSILRNAYNEIILVEKIQVDIKWKAYVEYMILKTKPVQMTAVIFIDWVESGT